jgi:hypothetical protein
MVLLGCKVHKWLHRLQFTLHTNDAIQNESWRPLLLPQAYAKNAAIFNSRALNLLSKGFV